MRKRSPFIGFWLPKIAQREGKIYWQLVIEFLGGSLYFGIVSSFCLIVVVDPRRMLVRLVPDGRSTDRPTLAVRLRSCW